MDLPAETIYLQTNFIKPYNIYFPAQTYYIGYVLNQKINVTLLWDIYILRSLKSKDVVSRIMYLSVVCCMWSSLHPKAFILYIAQNMRVAIRKKL